MPSLESISLKNTSFFRACLAPQCFVSGFILIFVCLFDLVWFFAPQCLGLEMSTFLKSRVGGLVRIARLHLHPRILHSTGPYTCLQGPRVTVAASWSASHLLLLPVATSPWSIGGLLRPHCSKVPEAYNWWLCPRPWLPQSSLRTLTQANYNLTPSPSCIFLSVCLSPSPCHLCKARSASPSARGCLLCKISPLLLFGSCKSVLSHPRVYRELHLCSSRAVFHFCFVLWG